MLFRPLEACRLDLDRDAASDDARTRPQRADAKRRPAQAQSIKRIGYRAGVELSKPGNSLVCHRYAPPSTPHLGRISWYDCHR
jgi:hypothetical protein